jgi:hypothetical protein
MLDTPTRAVVRRFPDTYITSYRRKGVDINPALALEQHRRTPRLSGAWVFSSRRRERWTALMPSRNPAAEQLVNGFASRHGLSVDVLDISEFEKGGGSLSCLSLLWRDEQCIRLHPR